MKDFYIIKLPQRWHKVLDTPKGMTWYEYEIIDGQVKWTYDSFSPNKKINDYNENFTILDYNPTIHDPMIIKEHKQ